MRCSTKRLSALLLTAAALAAAPPAPSPDPPGVGLAEGAADVLYLLEAPPGAPPPPPVVSGGFRQTVRTRPGGWEVAVSSSPRPLPSSPLPPPRWDSPALGVLPDPFRKDLQAALAGAADPDQACASLCAFLGSRLAYGEGPEASGDPGPVSRLGRASCVGRARVALLALSALGLSGRPIVGIRAPVDGGPLRLEGGALHVWLEVWAPGGPPAYLDPAFSVGWVPARYIVLREGGGDGPGDLAGWRGGRLQTLWRRDRIFFTPAPSGETRIWRALSRPGGGAAILGKLLDGRDAPLSGTAYLRGPAGTVASPLWEGNFAFAGLPPGDYDLALDSGGPAARETFSLRPLDKRTRVFYSRDGRGHAADHGIGRQPGGSLPP